MNYRTKRLGIGMLFLIGGVFASFIYVRMVSVDKNPISELVKLNLEALTTNESPVKKAEKRTEKNIKEEKRDHWTDGYNHYDNVTVLEYEYVICEGIGYIDCTSSLSLKSTDFRMENCQYTSAADCEFFRK